MTVLIIDNYDSFVFNLARYVAEIGGNYEVVRNDQITITEIESMKPSHIVLSPGPCSPNEAGICLKVVEHFLLRIPLLGICLGHQAIAQACGAKVIRAQFPKHGKADKIFHDGTGLFAGLPRSFSVARYHSLIVEGHTLPALLRVTAVTQEQEIMALCHRHLPVFGLQFHPESILTEHGHAMLRTFLACRKF